MIPKITIPVLIISAIFFVSTPMFGQLCEASKKRSYSKIQTLEEQIIKDNEIPAKKLKEKTVTPHVTRKRVSIKLPPDYKPPVADEKLIIFPETHASKKKQKKLRKKRKKGKKQGCIARSL
jgi:hypothetical protein